MFRALLFFEDKRYMDICVYKTYACSFLLKIIGFVSAPSHIAESVSILMVKDRAYQSKAT